MGRLWVTGMPPGMMPSIAAGIPPGATLTIPGGYLAEGTQRGRFVTAQIITHHQPTSTVEKTQQRYPTSLLEPGLLFLSSYKGGL